MERKSLLCFFFCLRHAGFLDFTLIRRNESLAGFSGIHLLNISAQGMESCGHRGDFRKRLLLRRLFVIDIKPSVQLFYVGTCKQFQPVLRLFFRLVLRGKNLPESVINMESVRGHLHRPRVECFKKLRVQHTV